MGGKGGLARSRRPDDEDRPPGHLHPGRVDVGFALGRRGQDVLRGPPLQEGEDVLERRRAERGAGRRRTDELARVRGDAIAAGRRRRGGSGGMVERADEAVGRRGVTRELEDARADGDPPDRGYRNSPSSANRLRTSSMSDRSVGGSAPSTAPATASAMASDPCEPSQ